MTAQVLLDNARGGLTSPVIECIQYENFQKERFSLTLQNVFNNTRGGLTTPVAKYDQLKDNL